MRTATKEMDMKTEAHCDLYKMIHYINVEKVTIDILRDFRDQLWKAENGRRKLREIDDSMTSLGCALNSIAVQGGGNKYEEMLCGGVDRKTVVEYGHRQALQYVKEFMPCWKRLTEEERFLLTCRFIEDSSSEKAGVTRVMERYSISKSEVYRRTDQALKRLSKLLFW